jgi:predicted DsbA family dithiol-disulfide isomerase
VADVGTVSISYVTDPFCPWSWAAEPSWRRLRSEFGDQVAITYVISGMGGAQPDPREWLEAAATSGMPVDPRGIMADPPASTNPAGLAVKAVAEQADPEPFLRRLREAIFLERHRLDRGGALLDVARETTPALDIETLRIAFGSHGPVEALGADFERAAGSPRPALWIGGDRASAADAPGAPAAADVGAASPVSAPAAGAAAPADAGAASPVAPPATGARAAGSAPAVAVVDGRAPYAEWRSALLAAGAEARDGALPIEDALRRFGPCTTAEIAALCDLPGPRAPAELWRLALEWRVRPRHVLGGESWELP